MATEGRKGAGTAPGASGATASGTAAPTSSDSGTGESLAAAGSASIASPTPSGASLQSPAPATGSHLPSVATSTAPPPQFPPARSPPVVATSRHSGIASPEHRQVRAVASSPGRLRSSPEGPQRMRASPERTQRLRASPERLPRTSPSNSPPHRSLLPGGLGSGSGTGVASGGGSGSPSVGVFYGGLAPAAAVPSTNVAGVAGPGGGGLAAYIGTLGLAGWGGSGGGASQAPHVSHQQAYPLALPPVSPASATSSGRYVFGLSPGSVASSSQQGRAFSVSSGTSGSELTYSPFGDVSNSEKELQRYLQMQQAGHTGSNGAQNAGSMKGFGRSLSRSNSGSSDINLSGVGVHSSGVGDGNEGTVHDQGLGGAESASGVASGEAGSAHTGGGVTGGVAVGDQVSEHSGHSGEGIDSASVASERLHAGSRGSSLRSNASALGRWPSGLSSAGLAGSHGAKMGTVVGGRSRVYGAGAAARGESKLGDRSNMSQDLRRQLVGDDGDSIAAYSESDFASTITSNNPYQRYGAEIAGAGGSEAWARVRGLGRTARHQARIRPTLERGASPGSTPRDGPVLPPGMASGITSVEDSGLEGVEFLSSPGGTGSLFDGFCSPLSEGTGGGAEIPFGDKLTTSIRYGSVGDIQANLERAERTQLIGRDGEGGSLLMHAAQRGETAVFGAVLDFLSEKLTVEEILAEFRAQDEDGQTPLVCAARSGNAAVFEQALEALVSRAAPEQVLQELTAKEKGDWTPLMAAADSGSVESFHRVLRAIGARGSEQMVLNELMTKDSGGWTPLVYAYRSGNRAVFLAAMETFLEKGEEGSRRLKEQLLSNVNDGKSCLLEAVASTGWLSRGPHLQPQVVELLDSAWDVLEGRLEGRHVVSVGLEVFQRAVRHHQDLTGLSCLLSHGCGLDAALLERLIESCGPRCARECLLGAVSTARNPLVPALGLIRTLTYAEPSCPLHASWIKWMLKSLQHLVLQILAVLPVSARALHKNRSGSVFYGGTGERGGGAGGGSMSVNGVLGAPNSGGDGMGGAGSNLPGVPGGNSHLLRSRRLGNKQTAGTLFNPGNAPGGTGHGGGGGAGAGAGAGGREAPGKWSSGVVFGAARARESLFVAQWMLEPESKTVGMREPSFYGPLAVAIEVEWSEFLSEPLIQDVLWAKFTAGIELESLATLAREPERSSNAKLNPSGRGNPTLTRVHSAATAASSASAAAATSSSTAPAVSVPLPAAAGGLSGEVNSGSAAAVAGGGAEDRQLSGCWGRFPVVWDVTVAPALQLILLGVATRPEVLYHVPAVRTALEGLLNLGMFVLYCFVLYDVRAGSLSEVELALYAWVLAMCLEQISEVKGGRICKPYTRVANRHCHRGHGKSRGLQRKPSLSGPPSYWLDGTIATVILVVAMICRLIDYSQDPSGGKRAARAAQGDGWGLFEVSVVLLAAAAPLLLLRLLFDMSVFIPELGPVSQAIAVLARETSKVVPTLVCLLAAVALALNALYGEGSPLLEDTSYAGGSYSGVSSDEASFVEEFRTYGASLATVVAAVLVELEPSPTLDIPYGEAIYVLLYGLGLVVTLGFVSILVAFIVNQDSASADRLEQEFHVARARTFVRAAKACEENSLPTPFNLLQGFLTLACSFGKMFRRGNDTKRKVGQGAVSFCGRLCLWLVMGPVAVCLLVVLHYVSLLLMSLRHMLWPGGESLTSRCMMLWRLISGIIGVPPRLVLCWALAVRGVFLGDRNRARLRANVRKSAIRGRQGGDYDLARWLRRTRWGAVVGRPSQGCSVDDMIEASEDPFGRGRFREETCFDSDNPSTVGQIRALAKRAQDYHTRTAERLKALEVAVLSNLGRMDSVLERAGPASCPPIARPGAPPPPAHAHR